MTSRDPFDIAPHASRNSVNGWATLVVGATLAFLGGWKLLSGLTQIEAAERLTAQGTAMRASRSVSTKNVNATVDQEVARMLRFSWVSLFDALENAARTVDNSATIVSIAPIAARSDDMQVDITGLAVSNAAMLEYLQELGRSPNVRDVRLVKQQPATNASAKVVGFQVALTWAPKERTTALDGDR